MLKIFTALLLMSLSTLTASAQEIVNRFRCEAPKGKRVAFGNECWFGKCYQRLSDGAVWSDDGFDGSSPTIEITPSVLSVVWGDAVIPPYGQLLANSRTYRMPIEGRDPVSVFGLYRFSDTAGGFRPISIFRFFFNTNTLHRVGSTPYMLDGSVSVSAIYVAKCRPLE
jgi:hypothetical protein